jgi:hypothetical protein
MGPVAPQEHARLLLASAYLRPQVLVDLGRREELIAAERRHAVLVVVTEGCAGVVAEAAELTKQQLEVHPEC